MKKQVLILVCVVILVSGFFLFTRNSNSSSGTLFEAETAVFKTDAMDEEAEDPLIDGQTKRFELSLQEMVFVDVQGEVINPGVFEVDPTLRVGCLIDLAGGLAADASIRGLNRAARIYDEMVIFIPHVDDVSVGLGVGDHHESDEAQIVESGLISLSTASALQLQSLPGIGPVLSANIIDHRKTNGAFSSIDELVNVAGIGIQTVENIREFVKP